MMEEEILLGLRKSMGVSKKSFFEKYNLSLTEIFPNIIKLISEGLLIDEGEYIYIPTKYQYIANFIIVRVLEND